MNCPKCFNPIQPNQRFCEVCGAQIGGSEMDMNKTVAADPYEAQQEQSPWAEQQPQQTQQEQSPWAEQQPQQAQQEQSPWAEQQPQQQSNPWAQQPQQAQQQQNPWGQQQQSQYTPPQSQYNFSQQYQQYQQPSQYASSQQSYGNYGYGTAVATQKKPVNARLIIIIAASVVLLAGIVVGIIFGVKACSSNTHQLKNANGVVIAEDDSINVNDKDAESKISSYLVQSNASATAQSMTNEMNGGGTCSIYAKGNAMVFEIDLAVDVDSSRRDAFKSYMEQYGATFGSSLQQGRSESGVNNMVIVIAAVDKNRETFYSKVYH